MFLWLDIIGGALGVESREVPVMWTCVEQHHLPGEWLGWASGCVALLWEHQAREQSILRLLLLLYLNQVYWFFPFSLLDLAKPPVNEPREPEQFLMQTPQGNPLLLSHTLQELLSKDSVQVELIPEKKGLFLKHVEYEVSSKVTWTSFGLGENVFSYKCFCWQSPEWFRCAGWCWFYIDQLCGLSFRAVALGLPDLGFCSMNI